MVVLKEPFLGWWSNYEDRKGHGLVTLYCCYAEGGITV
jgi:hypothetical protein